MGQIIEKKKKRNSFGVVNDEWVARDTTAEHDEHAAKVRAADRERDAERERATEEADRARTIRMADPLTAHEAVVADRLAIKVRRAEQAAASNVATFKARLAKVKRGRISAVDACKLAGLAPSPLAIAMLERRGASYVGPHATTPNCVRLGTFCPESIDNLLAILNAEADRPIDDTLDYAELRDAFPNHNDLDATLAGLRAVGVRIIGDVVAGFSIRIRVCLWDADRLGPFETKTNGRWVIYRTWRAEAARIANRGGSPQSPNNSAA